MANYASLLATIANNITDNNSGAITGPILKSVLDSMVGSLGTGYQFMGVATTSTNPGTPDQKVYYLAGPGTYTNFNNLVVADGEIAILKYDSAWSKVTTPIASAAEVSQLGQEVDEELRQINSGILVTPPNYTEGLKLTKTGTTEADENACVSDFFPWDGSNKVNIFRGDTAWIGWACFYDANKSFLDWVGVGTSRTYTASLLESVAYMRIDFGKTATGDIEVTNGSRDLIWTKLDNGDTIDLSDYPEVKEDVIELTEKVGNLDTDVDALVWEQGILKDIPYILHQYLSDGIPAYHEKRAITDFIDITGMSYIKSVGIADADYTYYFRVSYYDAAKNVITTQLTAFYNSDTDVYLLHSKYIRIQVMKYDSESTEVEVLASDMEGLRFNMAMYYDKYDYIGERINIRPSLAWRTIACGTYDDTMQDGDAYNNQLFLFYSQDSSSTRFQGVEVIDLADGALLQQISLPVESNAHNNGVSFGTEKWDDNDVYPLIYCSGLYNQKTYVYRITGDVGSMALTKVQTISFNHNFTGFVDKENGHYVIRWPKTSSTDEYLVFALPDPHSGDVTLNAADAIDSFELRSTNPFGVETSDPGGQGGTIIDGILYQCTGFSQRRGWMDAIDLSTHTILSSVNFTDIGLDAEPEGVFYHNGKLGAIFNQIRLIVDIDFN